LGTPFSRAAGVEGQEDQGRDGRPGQGGHDREGGAAGVAQPADGEFAFDLQADDQEEDGHQGVIDPVAQIPAQAAHHDLVVPEALVAVGQGAVGQGQGGDGGGQQDRPSHGLDAQELHHRVQDAAGVRRKGIAAPVGRLVSREPTGRAPVGRQGELMLMVVGVRRWWWPTAAR
jgi:hypothetical protein